MSQQAFSGLHVVFAPPLQFTLPGVRGLRESLQPELQHMDAEAFATLRREWAEAPRPAADGLRSVISKQVCVCGGGSSYAPPPPYKEGHHHDCAESPLPPTCV